MYDIQEPDHDSPRPVIPIVRPSLQRRRQGNGEKPRMGLDDGLTMVKIVHDGYTRLIELQQCDYGYI